MPAINFIDNPPRPASGDGDVIFDVGGRELLFHWEGGEIKSVASASENESGGFGDLTMKGETSAIQCFRCAVDTDTGMWWCWHVPCGT